MSRLAAAGVIAALLIAAPQRMSAQDLAAPNPSTTSTFQGAFVDSLKLLMIEHTTRLALSAHTRQQLGGDFVDDYRRSIKIPQTWEDGDHWTVNYVGHPIHGAAAGFIWLDHEAGAHDPSLGFSKDYWMSRSRAFLWATVYSVQFEFGPLSEASIGNVGMKPGTSGWVDHVVTPVGAMSFMVAEDALDRYFLTPSESWTGNRFFIASLRMIFQPQSHALKPRAGPRALVSRRAATPLAPF